MSLKGIMRQNRAVHDKKHKATWIQFERLIAKEEKARATKAAKELKKRAKPKQPKQPE
jgi:hypothetical protein